LEARVKELNDELMRTYRSRDMKSDFLNDARTRLKNTQDECVEGHEDDDIYQEEIEVNHNFMVSDGAGLAELDTDDVELLDEEAGPSNKRLQKSKRLLERQERRE
jgi:hypothetical protein